MSKRAYGLCASLLAGIFLMTAVGCHQRTGGVEESPAEKTSDNPHFKLGKEHGGMSDSFTGTVVEKIEVGRSVYVQVDVGEKRVWVAVPDFEGDIGDEVVVPPGVPVADFHSRKLDRDLGMVYFVGGLHEEGEAPEEADQPKLPEDHPPLGDQGGEQMTHPPMEDFSAGTKVEVGSIEKAKGGSTVSEIKTNPKALAGKEVLVRAKVVKFTPNIMDKNWLHVQDGTGDEETRDLVVTTDAKVDIGDIVLIRGVVKVDRDFGYGLRYPVILEDAEVAVE